jgi:DNA-binding transcriptional ArsR family regulator
MPRAATTSDVYNAIAEPGRRAIIDLLARGVDSRDDGHAVGALVSALRMNQPAVSKHLRVLREVGIVSVHKRGRNRLYQLNARKLKPVFDWVAVFEQYWSNQLDRIKQRAERQAASLRSSSNHPRH